MLGWRLCGKDVLIFAAVQRSCLGPGILTVLIREQLQKADKCMEKCKEVARSSLKGDFGLIGNLIGYGGEKIPKITQGIIVLNSTLSWSFETNLESGLPICALHLLCAAGSR